MDIRMAKEKKIVENTAAGVKIHAKENRRLLMWRSMQCRGQPPTKRLVI
jgi:hypothetical protein